MLSRRVTDGETDLPISLCFHTCTTCKLLTTCYNSPWNIAALGGSAVPNFSVPSQAEGIHLTFDLLWSTLGWGTDARGGGLSSGEISLFSSVYPLDRCAMIKNWGKICQMAVPCLIIKGAPVPETVGSNLKALHTDSAFFLFSNSDLLLLCNANRMAQQDTTTIIY